MIIRSVTRNVDQKCVYRSIDSAGIRVLWEVTSLCNLKCDFCLVAIKRQAVPLERALAMANDLIECGASKFLISGGEPLLYPGIETLLEHLASRGVLVKLLTNGTMPNERVYSLIRNTPNMEVSLSLQTVNEEKADGIFKRKGAFTTIVSTIEALPRERLNIIAAVSTMNQDEIEAVVDWVAARGISCISLTNIFKDPNSQARFRADCRDYKVEDDGVVRLFELVERKRREYQGRLVIRTTQFHGDEEEHCGAGRSVLYLDSTGCLLPCTLTENSAFREVGRSGIKQAVQYYREHLPALPDSSCVPLFQIAARPLAAGV